MKTEILYKGADFSLSHWTVSSQVFTGVVLFYTQSFQEALCICLSNMEN